MEILFWIAVLTWMAKRSTEDVLHALKGTPNPRYELKKAKAKAAGQAPPRQPRYGGKEWFADLLSDAMVANTEKRRAKAKAKAQPVDDMVDVVREPAARPPQWLTPDPHESDWLAEGRRLCPRCKAGLLADLSNGGTACPVCDPPPDRDETPVPQQPTPQRTDDSPTARIYQFPNPKHVEKEITMANSEVTGLSTAIAYADAVSKAHESFTSSGAEGYIGALEQGGNGPEVVASAREAMEASSIATEKWAAHREVLAQQMTVKEAYQSQPDAANKDFLLNA